jgi:hypothetical protein
MIFLVLYLLVFGLLTYAFFRIQGNIDEQIKAQGISAFQVGFWMDLCAVLFPLVPIIAQWWILFSLFLQST